MAARAPAEGVAMAIALTPMGVLPPGVSMGVACPGVACGVMLGVMFGVMAFAFVGVIAGVAFDGVSSQRERRLEAPGVDSMDMLSTPAPLPVRSGLGVSAHPLCPGVSRSVFGVSSQRFLLADFSCPGVSWPGVIA